MIESDPEKKVFVVTLSSKLDAGATVSIVAEEIYAQAVTPFPKYNSCFFKVYFLLGHKIFCKSSSA